jgi:tetraacyldisaccharide 4'-kinase
MNQPAYIRLISGKTTGLARLGGVVARAFLRVAALPYLTAVSLRNFLYDRGWLKIHRVNALVISVGNITVGGTGKTPLVVWLCNFMRKKNIRCAVLTRGYKATQNSKLKTKNYTDEPAIIANNCPGIRVLVNPDRIASAVEAIENLGAQVLILDDGFQHRRLGRDIDIVTIDATEPFGYGRLLPAGLLREPISSLKRANVIVITRCNQVSHIELAHLEDKLLQLNPQIIIARSIHSPAAVRFLSGTVIRPEELKNKKVFAFCGIGNPDAFLGTIKEAGACLIGCMMFDNHHHYTKKCLGRIREQAMNNKAEIVLTTEKDWTKMAYLRTIEQDIPIAYLAVEMKFVAGDAALISLIEGVPGGKIRPVIGTKT